jgi:hypothetical protein
MSEIVQARLGWEGEETFKLYQDGRGVVGHDKLPSEVTVKISVLEIPKAFEALEVDEAAKGPRKLLVTVVSAKHLPKVREMGTVAFVLHLTVECAILHDSQGEVRVCMQRHKSVRKNQSVWAFARVVMATRLAQHESVFDEAFNR